MEGLTITRKFAPQSHDTNNSIKGIAILCLLIPVLLILGLLFLLGWLIVTVYEKIVPPKPTTLPEPQPPILYEVPAFPALRYYYIISNEISAGAQEFFDDEPLIVYVSEPAASFFDGYFTDFKVEAPSGIFVQKVVFNVDLSEVQSMPLFFFNYATQESEEIFDFKDYTLHTKGNPNQFLLIADGGETGENIEFEITLTDTLSQAPANS